MTNPIETVCSSISKRSIAIVLAASGISLALLYGYWPYQHGHLDHRSSVLHGVLLLMQLDAEWIFCPFVPVVSALLIWRKREEIMRLSWRGSRWGLLPLVFAIALYWFGYKADTRYAGFASAQIMCAALLIWFGGLPLFKLLLFPWIFLVFTWPMLPLEELLAFPLRQITTNVSSLFLNLIGIENIKNGTAIISAADPSRGLVQGELFSQDVDAPCSGIRSLFSLIMISAFYGYMALQGGARRLVLFLAAIPLAMLGNFVRIIMLTFGSILVSSEWAIGSNDQPSTFHMFSGFCVFAVALTGMFGIARVLERIAFETRGEAIVETPHDQTEQSTFNTKVIEGSVVVTLAVVTVALCEMTPVSHRLSDPGLTMELPANLEEFEAEDIGMSSIEKQAFDEGVEMARSLYQSPRGYQFICTLVLSGPIKRSLHRPEVCMPGQGWKIDRSEVIKLRAKDGRVQDATLLYLFKEHRSEDGRRMRTRAYNVYWYVGYDIATPNYVTHVILSHRDSVFRNINHRWGMASLFMMNAARPVGQSDPLASIASAAFITEIGGKMLPHIQKF